MPAMLDSGTQPSVIDVGSKRNLGITYTHTSGKVHGLCSNPVKVCGKAEVVVDVGDGISVRQNFSVIELESKKATIILRRNFLSTYTSVEFDWVGHRVRLGNFWKQTEAFLTGGPSLSRAAVVNSVVSDQTMLGDNWDINPNLLPFQKNQLESLIISFVGCFCHKS